MADHQVQHDPERERLQERREEAPILPEEDPLLKRSKAFKENLKTLYDEQRDLVNQGYTRTFTVLTLYTTLFIFSLSLLLSNGLLGRTSCCSVPKVSGPLRQANIVGCCSIKQDLDALYNLEATNSDSGLPPSYQIPPVTLPTCCQSSNVAHQFKDCVLQLESQTILCRQGAQNVSVATFPKLPDTVDNDTFNIEQVLQFVLQVYKDDCPVDSSSIHLRGVARALLISLTVVGVSLTAFAIGQSLHTAICGQKVHILRAFLEGKTAAELDKTYYMKTHPGVLSFAKDLLRTLFFSAPFYSVPLLAMVLAFSIAGLIWSTFDHQYCGQGGTFFSSSWWSYFLIIGSEVAGILILYVMLGYLRMEQYKEEFADMQKKLAYLAKEEETGQLAMSSAL